MKKDPALFKLENYLLKKLGKAMFDYSMLDDNDRILVAVSGGKDSWSMLRLMILKNRELPPKKKYTLVAAHVNFGTCEQQDRAFDDVFRELGIEYHIENAVLPAKNDPKLSNCFWCSWNRRKILFNLADKCSCRKVAFGHHMDDIVETLLMNQFFYGEISTMPPNISLFEGKIHIIRPLAYISEKSLYEYATKTKLPFCMCKCPMAPEDSRRKMVKELLNNLEAECPCLKKNLFRSMKKIKEGFLA